LISAGAGIGLRSALPRSKVGRRDAMFFFNNYFIPVCETTPPH
jgi:hypothetical protein